MALSNAERQKRFRQRRKKLANALRVERVGLKEDPRQYAKNVLALLVEAVRHGAACRATCDRRYEVLGITVPIKLDRLPAPLRNIFSVDNGWIAESTAKALAEEGEGCLYISIEVETKPRKRGIETPPVRGFI